MGSTIYRHDEFDRDPAASRIAVFRDQIERRLAGEITEEQFAPMRRMNGVHLWDHAYILRIPVPRGVLSSSQLRMLAHVARTYDRGHAHFTAHRSIEFHWPALSDIPSALGDLASAGLYPADRDDNPADAGHDDPYHESMTIPLDNSRELSGSQLETLADLAETYGSGEAHFSDNEIVLPHIAHADLAAVHDGFAASSFDDHRPSDTMPFTEGHHAREAEAA
jgi:sulfite reductase beta subunit-like hemoprotein